MIFNVYPNKGTLLKEYTVAAAQTFLEGAAVFLVAGLVTECGADPATILGFAAHEHDAGPDPTKVLVWVATDDATFIVQDILVTAPVVADLGTPQGCNPEAVTGIWGLDKGVAIVNHSLMIERIFTDRNQYEVKVLPAFRQLG